MTEPDRSTWRFAPTRFGVLVGTVLLAFSLIILVGALATPSFPHSVAVPPDLERIGPWPEERSRFEKLPTGQSSRLIVLLHGFSDGEGGDTLNELATLVRAIHPEADILRPELPLFPWSFEDIEIVSEQLVKRIDQLNREKSYERITIAGHSSGAAIARKLWVLARGARFDGTVKDDRFTAWGSKIDRVVLLAGMNRGWRVGSALGSVNRLKFSLGALFGHMASAAHYEPTIFAFRRGAPFITRMRLQWMEVERTLSHEAKLPLTVQLVGTNDDLVAPYDHVDLASGRSFRYVELPGADHVEIIETSGLLLQSRQPGSCLFKLPDDRQAERANKICLAFTGTEEEVKEIALPQPDVEALARESLVDETGTNVIGPGDVLAEPARTDGPVPNLVFVIHGIRDEGYWTRRLAKAIRDDSTTAGKFLTVTDSYGYFPMAQFIMPWTRRTKVEWLMDRFVTLHSRYARDERLRLHYVGHSNGTYLIGKALEVLPMKQFRFEKIVTAGSVLPSDHKWPLTENGPGVGCVANYVATADWVVAIFPNGLSLWGLFGELGSAGHDGFGGDPYQEGVETIGALSNVRWVEGGHSAALRQDRWQEIARFVTNEGKDCFRQGEVGQNVSEEILTKDCPPEAVAGDAAKCSQRNKPLVAAGLLSPFLVGVIVLFIGWVSWRFIRRMRLPNFLRGFSFVAWISFVVWVAMQF
jgi:pimeloyl-ACP methyl ester carboxylesterase